ncbi:MAG: DUF1573 domain-containing protein [Chitinophagaceae bacterium]|nr:DUF1573 domain-containing protein [Chitinophagaceae bacterium]
MKRVYILFVAVALMSSCLNKTDKEKNLAEATTAPVANSAPSDSATFTSIQWLDSSKSMGTINEGTVLKVSYRFKNAGEKPLVIQNVRPGCGCTVADYPKTPIAPGGEGEITAEFDSHGKTGIQKKNIMVDANTALHSYTLWFDVTVNKAEK